MILHLPRKYRPPLQSTGEDYEGNYKTIEELKDADRKKSLYKQFRRIKL